MTENNMIWSNSSAPTDADLLKFITDHPDDCLQYRSPDGSIDLDGVKSRMKEIRRTQVLEKHPYKIYQGRDDRWRTYVKDDSKKTGRKMLVKPTREGLEDAVYAHYTGADPEELKRRATMESLFDDWIAYKALHVSESTVMRDRQTWNRYYASSDIICRPIIELTKLDLDIWIHEMIRKHDMNKHQYTSFKTIIGQELDYAVDREIIDTNPFRKVRVDCKRVLKPEHKKPDKSQVYTREELAKLRDMAWKDYHSRRHKVHELTPLAVMFMFVTGLRIGEVCVIRYEDVDENELIVRRFYRHWTDEVIDGTKGTFGDRRVLLIPEAQELIKAAKVRQKEKGVSTKGYIFSMNEDPLLYSAIQKAFYKYCDDMGIESKSSHKARKTYVSSLAAGGVNINTIRQYVGHQDERTTLANYCYDRSTDEEKMKQVQKALES